MHYDDDNGGITMRFDAFADTELLSAYGELIRELTKRSIIISWNVVGDLGKHIAISYYCEQRHLTNLSRTPTGTRNVDAISSQGDRYSIKSTTRGTTSPFWGLEPPSSEVPQDRIFEFVLIVVFSKSLELLHINEVTWDQFLQFRRWHSRMQAWTLSVTKRLLTMTNQVYCKEA